MWYLSQIYNQLRFLVTIALMTFVDEPEYIPWPCAWLDLNVLRDNRELFGSVILLKHNALKENLLLASVEELLKCAFNSHIEVVILLVECSVVSLVEVFYVRHLFSLFYSKFKLNALPSRDTVKGFEVPKNFSNI
jgi:hypothetical protein